MKLPTNTLIYHDRPAASTLPPNLPVLVTGDLVAVWTYRSQSLISNRCVSVLSGFDIRGFASVNGELFKPLNLSYPGGNRWQSTSNPQKTIVPATNEHIEGHNAALMRTVIGSLGREPTTDAQVEAIYAAAVGCGAVCPATLIERIA